MKPVLVFKDRFGHRWIERNTLRIIFGISAPGIPRWYNYDKLLIHSTFWYNYDKLHRSTFHKQGGYRYGY